MLIWYPDPTELEAYTQLSHSESSHPGETTPGSKANQIPTMSGKGGDGPDPKRGQVRLSWALGKENLTQTGTAQAFKGHFLFSPPVTAVLWTLLPMCRLLTTAGFGSWRTGRFTCPLMALLCLHNTWLSLCRWSRCKTLPSRFGRVWWTQIVNARRSG